MYIIENNDLHGLTGIITSGEYLSRVSGGMITHSHRIKKFIDNEYWSFDGLTYLFGIGNDSKSGTNVTVMKTMGRSVIEEINAESIILPVGVFGAKSVTYKSGTMINFGSPIFSLHVGQKIIMGNNVTEILENAVILKEGDRPQLLLLIDHNGRELLMTSDANCTHITIQEICAKEESLSPYH